MIEIEVQCDDCGEYFPADFRYCYDCKEDPIGEEE